MVVVSHLSDSRYCRRCRRVVLAYFDSPTMGVHFVLTFVTCGLWLPVFLWKGTFGKVYRCKYCGGLV